jgi:hypothetical protein
MDKTDVYFNPLNFYVRSINKSVAKDLIIKNHYTHKWSLCSVAYGIFYKSSINCNRFIEGDTDTLIGTCIYGTPVGRSASTSFSSMISPHEVLELTRLWIADGYGKNIESWAISQTFKLLKKEFPKIKIIMSYSDEEQGHKGTIYQATGFYYQGNKSIALMPNYSVSLVGPPNFQWIHSRTVQSTFGSHNTDHLKKKIGKTFWRKKESNKHRYFYILTNKILKEKILTSLKHPLKPYPTGTKFNEEIEQIDVINETENQFFT